MLAGSLTSISIGMRVDAVLAQFFGGRFCLWQVTRSEQNGDVFFPELAGGFKSDAFVGAGDQGSFFIVHNRYSVLSIR